jgi:hypothetical protein
MCSKDESKFILLHEGKKNIGIVERWIVGKTEHCYEEMIPLRIRILLVESTKYNISN